MLVNYEPFSLHNIEKLHVLICTQVHFQNVKCMKASVSILLQVCENMMKVQL
jgi:hypothetical protein